MKVPREPIEVFRWGEIVGRVLTYCEQVGIGTTLIGYSLSGAPRGRAAELIELTGRSSGLALSLDVRSGVDATTGETLGVAVRPDRTLTLALPKHGLVRVADELFVADIGIRPEVFVRAGIRSEPFFGGESWVRVRHEG